MSAFSFQAIAQRVQLDFRVGAESRRRILLASAFPGIVLAAALVQFLLEFAYSRSDLYAPLGYSRAPEIWQRLYILLVGVRYVQVAALAGLSAAAILQWSRAEGSWMFAIGATLAGLALILGIVAALMQAAIRDFEFLEEIRLSSWQQLPPTFGLLSVGYFFVAYRGLGSVRRLSPVPRARRRRPPTNPSLES